MAASDEQHEPVRPDAADRTMAPAVGRGGASAVCARVSVLHFQMRGRLLSVAGVPESDRPRAGGSVLACCGEAAVPVHPRSGVRGGGWQVCAEGEGLRAPRPRCDFLKKSRYQL